METAVFNELERRGAEAGYVKTAEDFEVDFYVQHRDGGRELIQVCVDPTAAEVAAREFRALASASKAAPKMPTALLVLTQKQAMALTGKSFSALPAYEWLLGKP